MFMVTTWKLTPKRLESNRDVSVICREIVVGDRSEARQSLEDKLF